MTIKERITKELCTDCAEVWEYVWNYCKEHDDPLFGNPLSSIPVNGFRSNKRTIEELCSRYYLVVFGYVTDSNTKLYMPFEDPEEGKKTYDSLDCPGRSWSRSVMSKEEIQSIWNKTMGYCYYCGAFIGISFHIDHILSRADGGDNSIDNLAPTCKRCNESKNHHSPEKLRFNLSRETGQPNFTKEQITWLESKGFKFKRDFVFFFERKKENDGQNN